MNTFAYDGACSFLWSNYLYHFIFIENGINIFYKFISILFCANYWSIALTWQSKCHSRVFYRRWLQNNYGQYLAKCLLLNAAHYFRIVSKAQRHIAQTYLFYSTSWKYLFSAFLIDWSYQLHLTGSSFIGGIMKYFSIFC